MSVEISPNEIDVLHYLGINNDLSNKEILQGVKLISSVAAIQNILTRLTTLGLLVAKNNVIYSLSELGRCLIGSSVPSEFLRKEMIRRGLPSSPVHRINNYPWGQRAKGFTSVVMAPSPPQKMAGYAAVNVNRVKTNKKSALADSSMPWRGDGFNRRETVIDQPTAPSKVVHLPPSHYVPSDDKDAAVRVEQRRKSKPFKKVAHKHVAKEVGRPVTNKELVDMSKSESSVIYFFSGSERSILTDLQANVVQSFDAGADLAVKALASRRVIYDVGGTWKLTRLGKKILSKEGLLPFTREMGLDKGERLLFEIIAHGDPFMVRTVHARDVLASNGLPSKSEDVRKIIARLTAKGLMLTRSNKMSYFTIGAIGLSGLTKVTTPRVVKGMLSVDGVDNKFIDKLESDNSEILSIAEELRTKFKAPVKAKVKEPVVLAEVDSEDQGELELDRKDAVPVRGEAIQETVADVDKSPLSEDAEKGVVDNGSVVWLKELEAKKAKIDKPEPPQLADKDKKVAFLSALSESLFPEEDSESASILAEIVNDYKIM